jgi:hypothetical protein
VKIPPPFKLPLTLILLTLLVGSYLTFSKHQLNAIENWQLWTYLSLIIIGIGGLWWHKKRNQPPNS